MDDTVHEATDGPDAAPTVAIEFTGRRGALFKLVLKNVLLNIVTIGIFRFWGKTRVRRFFWSNIVIGGEPLEYTGRGVELLIGFLIVLAVLIPLSLAAAGLRQLLGIGKTLPVVDLLYFAVFLFLVQFAVFRVWRYRLTRTLWRGIRFGLDGSAFPYAVRAFGWWIVRILTLGIIHPWANVNLMRYKVRRMRFGDTNFDFDGSGKELIGPWLIAWGVPVLTFLVTIAISLLVAIGVSLLRAEGGSEPTQEELIRLGVQVGGVSFPIVVGIAVVAFFLTFIWYRVRELRYFASCTRFGDATLASTAKARRIVLPMLLAGVILMAVFLLFIAVVAGVVSALISSDSANAMAVRAFAPLVSIAIALAGLLLTPIVTYPTVVFSIIRHVWRTLSVSDARAFEGAVQATGEGPKFGEGLADAFDVGAI